jgi:hypothetical protein
MSELKKYTKADLDKIAEACPHNQVWLDVDHFGWLWCMGCRRIGQLQGFKDNLETGKKEPIINWSGSYNLPGVTWTKTGYAGQGEKNVPAKVESP